MSNVIARTIFSTTVVQRSWKNYVTSGILHAVFIGVAFLVIVPAVQVFQTPASEHVTLLDPIIPRYHPNIDPPRIQHVAKLVLPAPAVVKPVIPSPIPKPVAKVIPPPVVPPPVVPPPPVAPEPKVVAEAKPDLPPPPKPAVKTGAFQDLQMSKAEPVPKQVVVGGFGDPRGVQTSENPKPSPVLMAKVGSFDSPIGAGQAGGGGRLDTRGIKQAGFGGPSGTSNSNGNPKAVVRTGNFGDGVVGGSPAGNATSTIRSSGFGTTVAAVSPHRDAPAPVAFTPVEILFKPRPSYSPEARNLRLEGQVSLEVVFTAGGSVKVVRVIKGLGHGLDEAAQQAAMQVRFKPATRSGSAVDTNATISITFELT